MSIATNRRSNMKSGLNKSLHKLVTTLLLLALFPATYATTSQKSGVIEAEYKGNQVEFPLLKSDYQVDIQGDLATIKLQQWFKNPTNEALDATYLFPLNKDSAVYAMQMQVGDELIEAKINRREEAEQIFEQAKQDGKAASLLTQHRPNMFTQRLANLMPDETIQVTLQYTQHIPRIDQHYELVLPLVVGPRYMPEINQSTDKQTTTRSEQVYNQWELQEHPDYPQVAGVDLPKSIESERVTITVRINGGMPIQTVSSQSHSITSTQENDNTREITLTTGKIIDNSDFILHYTLGGDAVQAGLLTHQDERGHFFSMLIEPPALPTDDQITAREMVFVLDTSGSMGGQPLNASKAFMRHAVKQLRTNDYFRIIDFGSSPREYSQTALPATTDNLYRGIEHINSLSARGGTEIVAAIEQAFKPETTANTMRIVVFLTDGYIGNESDVLAKINRLRGEARIYALGVGSSVNRYLLDEMAHAGRGFTRYIDPSKKAEDIAESAIQFANRLQTPV
ncbi:MAG: VIT and VWA domain-containing protein, partial [Thiotrichaceae bacterium]